jgi:soluble lytic murein transglycosylase
MSNARLGLKALLAGIASASVAVAMSTTLPLAAGSNTAIDTITTGSIRPSEALSAPEGSAEFRQGLKLIGDGNSGDAYTIGKSLPSDLERRTLQWAAIYFGAGKVDYNSVQRFGTDSPHFSTPSVMKTRMEQSLTKSAADNAEIIRVLAGSMPNTFDAQVALAVAYLDAGKTDRAARIAHDIWVNEFLDKDREAVVLNKLGKLLTRDTHWARAMHLMMHDRASGVERLLPYLSKGQKSLAVARIAVSRKANNAKALLDAVDQAYQDNPVFAFSRAQRARKAELYESAIDWLNKAKGDLPDAEEFWYERRTLIRNLLANGDAQLAFKAASTYQRQGSLRGHAQAFHPAGISSAGPVLARPLTHRPRR